MVAIVVDVLPAAACFSAEKVVNSLIAQRRMRLQASIAKREIT